jgi:RNA polymerase sigma-70 factor (ECF subfamily)
MSDDRLTRLCERLNSGDEAAAEEIFRSYEPYLRMVVRRQLTPRLRAKFDSIDVVQSVWEKMLPGLRASCWEFRDDAHLRAFLIRLTLNRFVSFYRTHRTSLRHEEQLGSTREAHLESREDRPSEVVQANELWEQLLALTEPSHHELLLLKTKGAPLAEIAERTGLHESSVRRILYRLEDRFDSLRSSERQGQEAECA